MRTPVSAPSASAASFAAPPASEVVHRPDQGLARGLWEASPGSLYLALGAVVIGAAVYMIARLGGRRRSRGSSSPGTRAS